MTKTPIPAVSVSQLQLNLSRTLAASAAQGTAYYISNRCDLTHLLLPIRLVTQEMLALLGLAEGPTPKPCCGSCTCSESVIKETKL